MDNNNAASNISPDTLNAIMKTVWKNPRTKANAQALQLSAEYFRLFITEAVQRAADMADQDGRPNDEIQVEHLEKVLTQLMLDF